MNVLNIFHAELRLVLFLSEPVSYWSLKANNTQYEKTWLRTVSLVLYTYEDEIDVG